MNAKEEGKFEEIIDCDSLESIISFIRNPLRIPLFFVNKRWRQVGQRKRRGNKYSKGLNYQKIVYYWESSHSNGYCYRPLSAEAALEGYFELMKWSVKMGCGWTEVIQSKSITKCIVMGEIAKFGDLDLLMWSRDRNCPWGAGFLGHAARSGNLEMIKWALKNGAPKDEKMGRNILTESLATHHFEVSQYAIENNLIGKERAVIDLSADTMDWMKQNLSEKLWREILRETMIFDTSRIDERDYCFHIETIEMSLELGIPIDYRNLCLCAIYKGNLEVLSWVKNSGNLLFDEWAYGFVLEIRNLEILKWLISEGAMEQRDSINQTCEDREVGKWGSFEVYNLLLGTGITFSSAILVCAIEEGHLEFAEILLRNGIRFDNDSDIDFKSISTLQFALKRGFEMNQKCYNSLAKRGKWKILDDLLRRGFNWDLEECLTAAHTRLQKGVVNWIKDQVLTSSHNN
eukprot:TRINITY_DN6115_c0_g1_i1.p1 TRINITY_DN6115_c0_g1~~TRINITY_DN6115_c0_g1_i1.p1  ORF type:complete len:459 (+),score=85.48 TRINITY_DN6115_c0_g1_i1:203-1579(+)